MRHYIQRTTGLQFTTGKPLFTKSISENWLIQKIESVQKRNVFACYKLLWYQMPKLLKRSGGNLYIGLGKNGKKFKNESKIIVPMSKKNRTKREKKTFLKRRNFFKPNNSKKKFETLVWDQMQLKTTIPTFILG